MTACAQPTLPNHLYSQRGTFLSKDSSQPFMWGNDPPGMLPSHYHFIGSIRLFTNAETLIFAHAQPEPLAIVQVTKA
jgi:hypothetical protein